MNCNMNASNMLAKIKETVFKDLDISIVATMPENKLQVFTQQQIDRLLGIGWSGEGVDVLTDFFWTADREFVPIYEDHPWLNEDGLPYTSEYLESQGMTHEEAMQADWILTTAMVGHDICNHFPFDLELLQKGLGMTNCTREKDFTYDNKSLMQFIEKNKNTKLAAHLTYIVYNQEIDLVRGVNEPAQDLYANHWSNWECFRRDEIVESEWIDSTMELICNVRAHIEEGRSLGMDDECIAVHDVLHGSLPPCFEGNYVKAAKAIQRKMTKKLRISFSKEVYDTQDKEYAEFCDLVKEIAEKNNITNLEKITYGYLADMLGYRWWRAD